MGGRLPKRRPPLRSRQLLNPRGEDRTELGWKVGDCPERKSHVFLISRFCFQFSPGTEVLTAAAAVQETRFESFNRLSGVRPFHNDSNRQLSQFGIQRSFRRSKADDIDGHSPCTGVERCRQVWKISHSSARRGSGATSLCTY